jgi:hypothetical protein
MPARCRAGAAAGPPPLVEGEHENLPIGDLFPGARGSRSCRPDGGSLVAWQGGLLGMTGAGSSG